ncbi:MAG: hypothetical protein LBI33_03390 [Propionibacteriaceae bacterium]|jgi:plasmid stability protein|nr:hypothetical protein [Propionibacteriaceae bacterium]
MPVLTIRNLDETTQRTLKHRAVDNNRSLEAEVRVILQEAARTSQVTHADALFTAAAAFREAARDTGFLLPERVSVEPREVFA